MKYLSPDVSAMKCQVKFIYKENIIIEFTKSTDRTQA